MNTPHLEITIQGECSACAHFFTIGGRGANEKPEGAIEALKAQFDKHFRKVHMRDDTSQVRKPSR